MNHAAYGICEEIYELQGERRISYGIAVYDDGVGKNTATVLYRISDITPDRDRLSELVDRCNLLKLSPIHLDEVVEDFLSD